MNTIMTNPTDSTETGGGSRSINLRVEAPMHAEVMRRLDAAGQALPPLLGAELERVLAQAETDPELRHLLAGRLRYADPHRVTYPVTRAQAERMAKLEVNRGFALNQALEAVARGLGIDVEAMPRPEPVERPEPGEVPLEATLEHRERLFDAIAEIRLAAERSRMDAEYRQQVLGG